MPAGVGVIEKRTEFWISEEELDRGDFDDQEEAFAESAKECTDNTAENTAPGNESKDTTPQASAAYLSRGRTVSNASTATAVDTNRDADVSSSSGSSTNHNHGSEDDLELGLHPPPRAHLS
ncbi:hypothetical protein HMPREF1624_02824 [Sporothrix schenckii ATCC 58251]|uniref:Uncharacterized protein n=2 Tax=Sporothrix schenckii TaxID=29908 RepID=U7Q140_SPOS1|nr:hypothetical protein HMPREF1624_02824 [Sporothrix schenckii ATCC 58251]